MNSSVQTNNNAAIALKLKKVEAIASTVQVGLKSGTLAVIAFCTMWSIQAVAGDTTGIAVGFFGDVRINVIVAWTLALSGIGYGARQRHLRHNAIERLQSRITTLEERVDPGRTTSGLTPRGKTRPEDT